MGTACPPSGRKSTYPSVQTSGTSSRVLLSQAEIAPIQWAVILVLATLILVTIAFVHIDRRLAMGITLFIFATALAICLVLLLVYDRPFSAGGFTVRPAVLRAVVPN